MKRNVIALFASVFACALLFAGCNSEPPVPVEPTFKEWAGDACPITGRKYDSADENDTMAGSIPIEFEHEGMKYIANVWDEGAMDEFNKNQDKYKQKIIDNSK